MYNPCVNELLDVAFFVELKLELLTQFPASNEEVIFINEN